DGQVPGNLSDWCGSWPPTSNQRRKPYKDKELGAEKLAATWPATSAVGRQWSSLMSFFWGESHASIPLSWPVSCAHCIPSCGSGNGRADPDFQTGRLQGSGESQLLSLPG